MTPASEKRYKTQPGSWYTPPPETPLYAGIPYATRQYWVLATRTERALLEYLTWATDEHGNRIRQPFAKRRDDQSWDVLPPGMTQIAKALACDRSTVVRTYASLRAKHYIGQSFEFYKGTRKFKGKRVVVYSFERALAERRKDDAIAMTNDKRVVFRGRGRKPMTPADAHAWRVQLDRVPEFIEAAHATAMEGDEYDQMAPPIIESDSPRQAAAAPIVEMPAPPPVPSEPGPIFGALLEVVTAGAPSERDAAEVSRLIDPAIPRELVAAWVRDIAAGRKKINPREIHSVGYFIKRLPDYLARHRLTEQRAAAERARTQSHERDARINRLAALLQEEASSTDPVERAQYGEFFAGADPGELEAARSALAHTRSRTG